MEPHWTGVWPCGFLQFEANCFGQDGNVWRSTAVSHQQGFSNWAGWQSMSPLCSDTAGLDTTYSAFETVMHNNFIVLNWTWKQPKAMRRLWEKHAVSAGKGWPGEWAQRQENKRSGPMNTAYCFILKHDSHTQESSKCDVNLFK